MTVALTGFMGSGKSTVGKELAALLGIPFIDLDRYIEHKAGESIPEIIAEGEDRFRALEAEALRDVVIMSEIQNEDRVLALGGGTVGIKAIRHLLTGHMKCVYLRTGFDTICKRLEGELESRPLFSEKLYRERLPLYEEAAFTVDTDGREPEEIAREIRAFLENNC